MNLHGVLNKGQGRRLFAVGAVAALGLAIGAAPSMAVEVQKVWICHATSSDTNPYQIINPAVDSAEWEGHLSHVEDPPHVWKSDGTFGGVDYTAGPKPDIFGEPGAASPPAECLATTDDTKFGDLTLVKVVVNTGGGTALATAWTLDATGGPTAFAEGTTGVHQEVAEGTYTLSELPAATTNYTASAWDCTNTEVNGTTVIIGPNDRAVTCTITNTYVPTIVLTTVAAPRFTPGTCLAVGSVVATETSAYSWAITGTAIAPIYTAVAKTGYTLTGTTSWTLDLSKIGKIASQSVDANGLCYVAPIVLGVVEDAPVVAGVVEDAPVTTLAFTGAETVPLGLSGLLALVLGAVLTVASRRQRPKQARE